VFSESRIPWVLWNMVVSTMFIQLRLRSASCVRWIQHTLISPCLFKTHVIITAISICRSSTRFFSFRNFHWNHVCIFPLHVTHSARGIPIQFNFLLISVRIKINQTLIKQCSLKLLNTMQKNSCHQIFNVSHCNYVTIKGVARTLYPHSDNNMNSYVPSRFSGLLGYDTI